jgi:Zn finger protein HypA/HybF involved in hydrogenase expression
MAAVAACVRVTASTRAVWRECVGCGAPAPMTGAEIRCPGCRNPARRVRSGRK